MGKRVLVLLRRFSTHFAQSVVSYFFQYYVVISEMKKDQLKLQCKGNE